MAIFSSKCFIVSVLTFRTLNYFEWTFCRWCEEGVWLHSFACEYPIITASFVENIIPSLLNYLGTLVKNNWLQMWCFICGLSILLHWSVFVPISYFVDYYSFVGVLKSSRMSPSYLFFFFSIILVVLGHLHFHMKLKITFSISIYSSPFVCYYCCTHNNYCTQSLLL